MQHSQRTIIENVAVLSLDEQVGELDSATITIDAGRITSIEPTPENPHLVRDHRAGDEVINGSGLVALPGFIDTHRHTWQSAIKHSYAELDPRVYFAEVLKGLGASYQAEDVYIGNKLGSYAALSAGTTTLFDWSHVQNSPEHSDGAIAGLHESGIRAVFGHGWPTSPDDSWTANSTRPHPADIRRVQNQYFPNGSLDDRITLAMVLRGPEEASPEIWQDELRLARELGLRVSVHTGAYARNAKAAAVQQYADAGLLGPDMTFVHCNHLTAQELKLIADNGGTVSLGIHCEMNSTGVGEIPFHRLLQTGIRPSLSGDTETKCTGDMFTQMRMLWAYHRSTLTRIGPERAAQVPTVTMRDILAYATIEGAKAIGQETEIGSLTPGKRADMLLIDTNALNLGPVQDPAASIVLAAHEGNVRHVLVGGTFVKRNGALTGVNAEALLQEGRRSQQNLLERANSRKSLAGI
ncbi:amidohydrolase family protein [Arthrobacter sp. ISL-85]|uniref:amidohydrolase family protein n=1 Tax=Arthrobacter sp. ISL-85 TaxID=2819115 RepID=UPI001BE61CC0|nr:amidohydrolase family protein [Arthrobacter sp. ISL-85]MBT2565899.1 amidohydrolase family protein [Arthrobacter sp. ISL-85]